MPIQPFDVAAPGNSLAPTPRPHHGLLDERGLHMLARVRELHAGGVYPYQFPLQGTAGPRARFADREMLLLSSYDYLGLLGHPEVTAAAVAAVREYGTGTGGVRLLTGTNELHRRLEVAIAAFIGFPAAVSFSSGYAANLALIPALLSPRDRVIMDELAHRSIVDACRLARVRVSRFRHNCPDSLRRQLRQRAPRGRTLVVAEGVYSMDGDLCPLPDLLRLKDEEGAYLMIDESHSFGVLGETGRGIAEHFGVPSERVDLWTTSLGKGIPSTGGVIAGPPDVVSYLEHGAPPFVFSAAACPAAVAAAQAALEVLVREPDRPERARRNADRLRFGLGALGYDTGASASPVVPVILGDEARTASFAHDLRRFGIHVTPILYPAVPRGAARLRLCATAAHTSADIDEAIEGFRHLAAGARVISDSRKAD